MLDYRLEKSGGKPLYLSLYEHIKDDIGRGALRSGDRLPSKRELAKKLGVSVVTVQNAYAQLLSEGHIYSVERSGYFVSELERTPPAPAPASAPPEPEPGNGGCFIDFCDNGIGERNFPFSVWAAKMREVLNEHDSELLHRIPGAGLLRLRVAVADFLRRFRDMDVSPEQIVVGAGTEYLYGLIIKLLGKGLVYAVEDPGYRRISEIYRAEGVECRFVPLDGSGLSVSGLERCGADVVHISPSHHFPTGAVMPIKRRQELLRWARSAGGRYIIEDDYDSEFRLAGRAFPTLQSIDAFGSVIYVNTFSKTISPAIRISYMVLPGRLLGRFRGLLGFYSCTVSAFEQYTLAKFMEEGHFERHINRMRRNYREVRDRIIGCIKSGPLRDRAEIFGEVSGLHFIMRLKTDVSDETLVREARERGVNISCLSQYSRHPGLVPRSAVVISYSGVDVSRVAEAMDVIAGIIG